MLKKLKWPWPKYKVRYEKLTVYWYVVYSRYSLFFYMYENLYGTLEEAEAAIDTMENRKVWYYY